MVSFILVFLFLCAATYSQNITLGNKEKLSTNFSGTIVDENEILSMIEQQVALCPYIALCTRTNRTTSTFIANKSGRYACCSECSCHYSCVAEGTCCPDFFFVESGLETESAKQAEVNTTDGISCVRTHHGIFNNNYDGFQMIASCPGNFTYKAIKQRCEIQIQFYDNETLLDMNPVIHKESSMSYKNIFCFLCNKAKEDDTILVNIESVNFWDSRIYCNNAIASFLYVEHHPFIFGSRLLQYGCNIIFHTNFDTQGSLKPCKFDDVIETCKSEYVATELETQCKLYNWPITGMPMGIGHKTETYKNYACMLCNGRTFSDNCFQYTPDSSLSSIFLTKTEPAFVVNLIENKPEKSYSDQICINQTINRYFPDSKGNIPCGKGFILDELTKACRHVFCPENFFLNDGICFPVFDRTDGILFFHLFQMTFPTSIVVKATDNFEAALVQATNKSLNENVGAGNYYLSVLNNEPVQGKTNLKYYALVILDDKYADGNYIEYLKAFYKLDNSVNRIQVREQDNSESIFEVRLRLTFDYRLQLDRFMGVSGEAVYLKQPHKQRFITDNYIVKANIFHVTIPQLCYRVGISISELGRTTTPGIFLLKRTNQKLSFPNFQKLNLETHLVCLEYALNDIASANKYLFDEYLSKKVLNQGESLLEDYGYKNEIPTENDVYLLERSIVISIATLVIVFIVVGSRVLLKRLTNR